MRRLKFRREHLDCCLDWIIDIKTGANSSIDDVEDGRVAAGGWQLFDKVKRY